VVLGGEHNCVVTLTGVIYDNSFAFYRFDYLCFQVVEGFRRIFFTGVLAVIKQGDASQAVVGVVAAIIFIRLYSVFGM
jgi:uncharacterized integral membrane protein